MGRWGGGVGGTRGPEPRDVIFGFCCVGVREYEHCFWLGYRRLYMQLRCFWGVVFDSYDDMTIYVLTLGLDSIT